MTIAIWLLLRIFIFLMQSPEGKVVQNLREMVQMRFRLTHPAALQLRRSEGLGLFRRIRASLRLEQGDAGAAPLELMFAEKLGEEHLLLGNQFQLTLFNLTGVMEDFVEVGADWDIAHAQPITGLFAFPLVRLFFVVCARTVHAYLYSPDSVERPPVLLSTLAFPETVEAVYLLNKMGVVCFGRTQLEVLGIAIHEGKTTLERLSSQKYWQRGSEPREQVSFETVPGGQGRKVTLFLRGEEGGATVQVYSLRVEVEVLGGTSEVRVGQLTAFCEVPQRYIGSLSISHYEGEVFLVHVGNELYATRNHYFLDNIITNTSKVRSFMKSLTRDTFCLHHRHQYDFYRYRLQAYPHKFTVACVDSIPLAQPPRSRFFELKNMGRRVLFIFEEPASDPRSLEMRFWLGISEPIDVDSKISALYPQSSQEVGQLTEAEVKDKVMLAQQIGLTHSEAYLELWRRSGRSSTRDYQLLVRTEDYEMIRGEVEELLRRAALPYATLSQLMGDSLRMLRKKVLSPECTLRNITHYSACHFLACKLRMWAREQQLAGRDLASLPLDIQQYYGLAELEIFKHLRDLADDVCADKPLNVPALRCLLGQFSLIFRLHYRELVEQLVPLLKGHLLPLLQALPELLPVAAEQALGEEERGAWVDVDLEDTERFFVVEALGTFENRGLMEEFGSSKNYKVYRWHTYGAIPQSVFRINRELEHNSPREVFISLYEQLHCHRGAIGRERLAALVEHIEEAYPLLPGHLRGRYWLYAGLHDSFRGYYESEQLRMLGVREFFSLEEDALFQLYFKTERVKKGVFILKEIKPLYEGTVAEGAALFLRNMFNFFKVEESSWSDLKIILNKFNSEKEDFHRRNHRVFEVLVRAIMEKVRVGGPDEQATAGLAEVMSYLENVPFPLRETQLLAHLMSLKEIRRREDVLRRIRVDMNIREILERGEEVIFLMVADGIERHQVREAESAQRMEVLAFKIIAETCYWRTCLYDLSHPSFPFKAFMMILMQEQRLVPLCLPLLSHPQLVRHCQVDDKLVENICTYLYRKRLHQNPIYVENLSYLEEITEVLPLHSPKRRFFELSGAFARMFSFPGRRISYPLFRSYYPLISEIKAIMAPLSREQTDTLSPEDMMRVVVEMKSLGEKVENIQETSRNAFFGKDEEEKWLVMKRELYTVVFLKYVQVGLVAKSVALAWQILAIPYRLHRFNSTLPTLLMELVHEELLARAVEPFSRLLSHYLPHQRDHLEIMTYLLDRDNKFSNADLDEFIDYKRRQKEDALVFSPDNPLLSPLFRRRFEEWPYPSMRTQVFNDCFEHVWARLQASREELRKVPAYSLVYRMLLHDPFLLAEYLWRKRGGLNVRSLRALLCLMGAEAPFDMEQVLRFGERLFAVLLEKLRGEMLIDDIIEEYEGGARYTGEIPETHHFMKEQVKWSGEQLIANSVLVFRDKIGYFEEQLREVEALKEEGLSCLLSHPEEALAKGASYPFQDADGGYVSNDYDLLLPLDEVEGEKGWEFDEVTERSELVEHLNYFIKPKLKKGGKSERMETFQDIVSEIFLKNNICQQDPALRNRRVSVAIDPTFLTRERSITGSALPEMEFKKSRSLKLLDVLLGPGGAAKPDDHHEDDALASLLPEAVGGRTLRRALAAFLKGRGPFPVHLLPRLEGAAAMDFLRAATHPIYNIFSAGLARRIELIWLLRDHYLGRGEEAQWLYCLSRRLGQCGAAEKLMVSVENLFPWVIFVEEFDWTGVIQLVKETVSELVVHEDDMLQVGEIVREVFVSGKVRDEVMLVFVVKLCKQFLATDDLPLKTTLKEQIVRLEASMEPEAIHNITEQFRLSRSDHMRGVARVLHGLSRHRRPSQ